MATEFISNSWLMPENSNQDRVSNYSLDFDDASSQYVETSSNVGISGSQSRTMSVWLKGGATNNGKNWPMAVAIGAGSTDKAMWIGGGGGPSAYWYFGWWGSPSATSGDIDSGVRMDADNDWHMLTSTYDESTQIAKGYIDGVEVASFSRTGINTTNSPLKIAKHLVSSVYWDGPITQVSIYDYSLSASQITQLYGTGSAIGNPMAITNGRKPINYYPLGNAAFNGEFLVPNGAEQDFVFDFVPNGYIQIPSSSDLIIGGDLTISFWFKTSATSGVLTPFMLYNDQVKIYIAGSDGLLRTLQRGASTFTTVGTTAVNDGNWHLCTAVLGLSETKVYLDNTLESSDSGFTRTTTAGGNAIGSRYFSSANSVFDGQMSNVSIFNTALPATGTESVESLYNYGTPPNIASYSNLQAWWELDASATFDGSNWSIPDASSNSNTGTSSGMTAANLILSDLVINQSYDPFSLSFDGTNDYIEVANNSSLQITDNLTLSCWINADNVSATNSIIDKFYDGADRSYLLRISGTRVKLYLGNTDGSSAPEYQSSSTLSNNVWYHVVTTFSSTDNEVKIYINGSLDSTHSKTDLISSNNEELRISTGYNLANYFDGKISNCSIYNSALSAAQVTTLYNEHKPFNLNNFEVTPVSWWRLGAVNSSFDGTNWTILDEISTSGNNGTSANMTQSDLVDGVGATGSGTSSGMSSGTNRTGDAPYSTSNSVSYNMSVTAKSSSTPT